MEKSGGVTQFEGGSKEWRDCEWASGGEGREGGQGREYWEGGREWVRTMGGAERFMSIAGRRLWRGKPFRMAVVRGGGGENSREGVWE